MSNLFLKVLDTYSVPRPTPEYQFHQERKWRFDYAWPDNKIALEVEGGVFGHRNKDGSWNSKGAHSSVKGILRDMEKYNAAAAQGWRILRVMPKDLLTTATIELIKQTFNSNGNKEKE